MRSHSSSRSHSSMHSHRSSMSSHRSSMSSHRSSMHSHSFCGSSSIGHRSSLASRRHTTGSGLRSHIGSRNGISNAHAFAVGKATGVNINGSAMGTHGAALHHSRQMRDRKIRNSIRRSTGESRAIKNYSTMNRRNRFNNSTSSTNSRRRRYTLNLNKYGNNEINQVENNMGIFILVFALMMVMGIIPFIFFAIIGIGLNFFM